MARDKLFPLGGVVAGVFLVGGVLVACQTQFWTAQARSADGVPDRVDYNWDVRPILAQNCFSCHGMDAKHRKAGLRLDVADGAYGRLPQDDRKHAIVPGNPGRSELFVRVTTSDVDARMPPLDSHKTLSPHDIAVIERWIRQGAKYERHWAYLPVKAVKPKATDWNNRAVNQIDRYVYATLKDHGLAPSAEADRETLINRVTLGLTGLPPTLAQVDAFVTDKSPDAYEKVVDRLLASPAYAERMASTWMDTARYADSNGYLFDGFIAGQFPYRDWVISAFKRNIPYDQFVTWQLAGDLLPDATREQILATAFARAGKKSNEGGIIDEEYRVEYVNERAELVGKAFLGLTVGCAKCHDHKYDVISQADYYSMGGFFNSIDEGGRHAKDARSTPNGPTLAWPSAQQSHDVFEKHMAVMRRQNERDAAVRAARQTAAATSARDASVLMAQDLAGAQQAYYPMEVVDRTKPIDPVFAMADGSPGPGAQASSGGGVRPGPAREKPRTKLEKAMLKLGLKPGAGGGGAMQRSARAASNEGKVGSRKAGAGLQKIGLKIAPAATFVRPQTTPRDKIAQDYLDAALDKANAEGLPLKNLPQVRSGFDAQKLVWSLSGVNGAAPAAISNPHFIDGPPGKGKALLIDDTTATADKDVGKFERTDAFSFDLWIKLAPKKVYDDVDILHRGATDGLAPGAGYRLSLAQNHLKFMLHNEAPYNAVEVVTQAPLPGGQWVHVAATYDGSSLAAGTKLYINGVEAPSKVEHDHLTRSITPGRARYLYEGLQFGGQFAMPEFGKGAIDELRVFTKALSPMEVAYLHRPAMLNQMGADAVRAGVVDILAQNDPRVIAANANLRGALLDEQAVETKVPQVMVMGDRREVRPTYLLERGVFDQHGKQVPVQALPQVFPYADRFPRNRLGLAEWLFDPKNPLTSRVYVNRLWQMHFGTGIVETVDDFGTQGSTPSNPALLDYLAAEFMRSGWDIRRMNKLIVMSATYRQSSNITPEALKDDPRNTYLARGPRFRLPAEMIRDNALSASGLLVDKVGGDSVFPYHPQQIWGETGLGYQAYPEDVPADQYHRRTLYTFIKRNAEFPSLAVFDLADRNGSQVARKISNTPLQSLVLLNDVQYREAYRKLAERVMKTTADPDQQIVNLFRLSTRRRPTDKELTDLKRFKQTMLERFASHPQDAVKITALGVAPIDTAVNRVQLAALSEVAAIVLNSPDAYSIR